ncbi:MAG: hypothetical protein KKA42_09360 [candidate division Zixibacteria bacterium]|nr:hypothetical protein [candidate division Zixibacteria bacterium]
MKAAILVLSVLLLAGCSDRVTMEFRLADDAPGDGLTGMALAGGGQTFYLNENIMFSNEDVVAATVPGDGDHPFVELTFSDDAAVRLAQFTEENIGRRVAMIIDGELLAAPIIQAPITAGKAVITGDFTREEAERIAVGLCPENPVAGS